MQKSTAIMELLSGYEAYSNAEELNAVSSVDAPATTILCATVSAGASWISSQFVSKTFAAGC